MECRTPTSDQRLRQPNLRAKFDVIIFPHTGVSGQQAISGIPKTGSVAIPYQKSELTPNLGVLDQTDDVRGGMGMEGLMELARFVEEGGTLITEGSTAALLAEFNLGAGVTVEHPSQLFARGSILRGTFADTESPIAYGYNEKDLPIYFNQDPVFRVGTAAGAAPGAAGYFADLNVAPNVTGVHLSPAESNDAAVPSPIMGGPGPLSAPVPAMLPPQPVAAPGGMNVANPFSGPSMASTIVPG